MKNTFAKMFTVCALAGVLGFALSACDDSSSAGDDDNNVILSGDSREESGDSRSNDKDEAISSSGKVTDKDSELAEVSSSSVVSSSSIGDVSKSYAETKVMPSGTFDCSKYNCFTTEYLNQEFLEAGKYGEILDERDGQVYKTVQIGEQIWMAQNLNYDPGDVSDLGDFAWSGCDSEASIQCTKYGRLYTWEVAMNKALCGQTVCKPSRVEQGICPVGWHLPNMDEFDTLFSNRMDGSNSLWSKSLWNTYRIKGTDDYGFSALPGGKKVSTHDFSGTTKAAYFWTSNERDDENAYFNSLSEGSGGVGGMRSFSNDYKRNAFSVRCIKNLGSSTNAQIFSSSSGIQEAKVMPSGTYDCSIYKCNPTDYLNQDFLDAGKYGEILDMLDSQVYKTIQIGNQVWMAQNLNNRLGSISMCFGSENSKVNGVCIYGTAYDWWDAMRFKDERWFSFYYPIKGACPQGWHLPNNSEWNDLITFVGGDTLALKKLRSNKGWLVGNDGTDNNGTDDYGFSALPSGVYGESSRHSGEGRLTKFWSSENSKDKYAKCAYFESGTNGVELSFQNKDYEASVRCIKDSD